MQRGFTLLEVIVALIIVGVGITSVLMVLSQGRRTLLLTRRWSDEQVEATRILFQRTEAWQQLRTGPARTSAMDQRGNSPVLGPWEWRMVEERRLEGRSLAMYRIAVTWEEGGVAREVSTTSALREHE